MAQVVLFEDHLLADMNPVTLTRPAFGVTCACYTFHEVARAAAGRDPAWIVRDYLAKVTAQRFPVVPLADGPRLYLNASIVPDVRYADRIRAFLSEGRPFIATAGRRVSAAYVPAGHPAPEPLTSDTLTPWLLELKLPLLEEECFRTLDSQYEVVKHHGPLFDRNLEARRASDGFREVHPGVWAAANVSIHPSAAFRTKDGPVVLDRDVEAQEFTLFVGPLYVGPRSRVIERASLKEQVCIGETCKIGGEVEASIVESWTNKQHHGFLGHSWVGSWVNLGAGTSNSDLKNTYGEVRLEFAHRRVDTGMQFLGCVIGDYAKSAINTSIFTGKIIGVSSMLYGFVGTNVASFCNYARSFGQITECPVEQAVMIQKRMFARRGITQTPDDAELLRQVFELTRGERLISDEPPAL